MGRHSDAGRGDGEGLSVPAVENDHFVSGKSYVHLVPASRVYTFTFNALTYGGYEMKPVTVTITAVDADTAKGEEAMK